MAFDSSASPIGPRTITRFRRVTVPHRLRTRAGWVSGSAVALDVLDSDREIIRIRTVSDGETGSSDPAAPNRPGAGAGPRLMTRVGQVSIPVTVLSEAGLDVLSRVYFIGVDGQPDTVWLLPEGRVRMADQARRRPRAKPMVAPDGGKVEGGLA